MKTLIFIIIQFLSVGLCFSQGQTTFWYFGKNAGVKFENFIPAPDTNGKINTLKPSASISSSKSELQFYATAIVAMNQNHDTVVNGANLLGTPPANQSPIFIPNPGNASVTYLVTDKYYSAVVQSPNNPEGEILQIKNFLLPEASNFHVRTTAVHHSNGKDIWLIQRLNSSDTILSYLFTEQGITSNPIISVVPGAFNNQGQIKSSPNGKFVIESCGFHDFTIHRFDNNTGALYNSIVFNDSINYFGSEFSGNSKRIYLSSFSFGTAGIYSFDISTFSLSSINQSKDTIFSSPSSITSLQIGIDKNIYTSHGFGTEINYLGKIEFPNSNLASYIDTSINLLTGECRFGLPDFIQSYFHPAYFDFSNLCFGDSATFYSRSNNADSVKWNFGDVTSGSLNFSTETNPKHSFSTPGNYNIRHIVFVDSSTDTFSRIITIKLPPEALGIGSNTTICIGDSIVLEPNPSQSWTNHLWMDSIYQNTFTINDSGTYWLNIWNECDTLYDTIRVHYNDSIILQPLTDTTFCFGDTLTLNATANTAVSWLWSNGDTTAQTHVFENGSNEIELWLEATNACGAVRDTAIITILPQPDVSWFSDSILCDQNLPLIAQPSTFGVKNTLLYNYNSNEFDTVSPWNIDTFGLYYLVAENMCDTVVRRAFLSPWQIIEKELPQNIALCPGQEVVLDAFWQGSSYLWNESVNTENQTDSAVVVSAPINQRTETQVFIVTITNSPCVKVVSTTIEYLSEDSCGNTCKFSLPNVITPNQDGVNDLLRIKNTCSNLDFQFHIYNRWGQLMHSGNQSLAAWDGSSNGQLVCNGVYFIVIEYTDAADNERVVHGSLEVISD